tara:strand:+ start:50 stop:178 length:129 start_codon:yes stop_codon:yes gene_type:complete
VRSDREKMILKLWEVFDAGYNEDYDKAEELILSMCKCVEVMA